MVRDLSATKLETYIPSQTQKLFLQFQPWEAHAVMWLWTLCGFHIHHHCKHHNVYLLNNWELTEILRVSDSALHVMPIKTSTHNFHSTIWVCIYIYIYSLMVWTPHQQSGWISDSCYKAKNISTFTSLRGIKVLWMKMISFRILILVILSFQAVLWSVFYQVCQTLLVKLIIKTICCKWHTQMVLLKLGM